MTAPTSTRADLIARLRTDVAADPVDSPVTPLSFGIAPLDSHLTGGGLGGAALHEVAAASPRLAEDAAASLFIAGIAARFGDRTRNVVWALSHFDLYSPGLEQAGLASRRTLFVEAREDSQVLAAMEDALRHGGLAAVVGEVRRADMTATRRLQLSATDGRTPAILYRRWRRAGACPLSDPSAAATRWRVGCAASEPLAVPGLGRARWHVELVRQRGGDPISLLMESCDAEGRLALPAAARDRAVAPGRATARAA